ncbi:hypothetical protein DKM44_06880 [Deinococcus irradiatisoli]|uniref:Lipoprotein n=1 Tax=Deinococcus irradiatisoli TaxID=2202254 RepID=A0A2Z3JCT8_9DEIO|nr:hypothetical protein [Deinococcus irradiatisoli]AWN22987.1 hypothetical protein DKM44_06880 [Deinococcus irradiatisoli]
MKRFLLAALACTLVGCMPRQNASVLALNCSGTRSGTLTQVPFTLSANIDPQTGEVAGVLTEAGDKSFWVYGRRVQNASDFNFILSVSDHTENYAGVDLIVKKARLGYFTNSQSTLSGVLSGKSFTGRQKAGLNNYEVTLACSSG